MLKKEKTDFKENKNKNHEIMRVSCEAGTFLGIKSESGIGVFKGIPYAQPPVGSLRWKPPAPVPPIEGEYKAFEFGDIPCQSFDEVTDPMSFETYTPSPHMSEDCLTLNIWTKDNEIRKKPVLFWIYGGAFIKGYGSSPLFDGNDLAENQDIVVVTINHREGLLATLNLSSLDQEGEYRFSSNLYILDQIQALRWCWLNVEAFGGDRDNITVCGHSSGSNSVTHLLVSEEAGKYFSKAICQSSFFTGSGHTPLEWSKKISDKVIELLGAKSLEEMKQLPVSEILNVQQKLFSIPFEGFTGKLFSPVTDGFTVPEDPYQQILNGRAAGKTVMFGYSDGEYDQMFMREQDEAAMLRMILSRLPRNVTVTQEFLRGFETNVPDRTRKQAYLDIYNEVYMHSAGLLLADAFAEAGGTCYFYCFKWWEDQFGRRAPHGAPNAFLFGNSLIPENAPPDMKRQIQKTWKHFMETGNPANDLIPPWEPYDKKSRKSMIIDGTWHMERDWKRKDFELAAPFFPEYEKLKKYAEGQIYDGCRRKHLYVPMDDGVRLSVVIYLPTLGGIEAKEPLPVVMQYTPYDHLIYTTDDDGRQAIGTNDGLNICRLIPYGYVVVFAHVRGCGASFGVRRVVCSRREARDGAAVVEWLAGQTFCDGRVMTAGQSYNGQTQLEILSQKPAHLAAAYIGKTDFNRYDGWVRNGIPRAFGSQPDIDWGNSAKETRQRIREVVARTVPTDGDEDKILLTQAVTEHVKNGLQMVAQRDLNWRDSYSEDCEGKIWELLSASTYLEDINASGVPVYLDGGCVDVFKRDTIMLYENLTLPKKLIFGPWDHVGPKTTPEPWTEIKRWADHWLKGIANGIMDEKPLKLRIMEYNFETKSYQGENTGYYRYEEKWPLHQGRRDICYLSGKDMGIPGVDNQGSLTAELPAQGELSYRSVFGIRSGVESKSLMSPDGMGAGQKGMNFFSRPFEKDTEYIGHPFAKLWFTLEDMGDMKEPYDLDFFVMLSDYDEKTGECFQFGNGWLRSSLRRESGSCPYNFLGLPWHENRIGSNEYLTPGETYYLNMDLVPVFYRFRAGHRLMVTISNSLDRTYYYGRNFYEADSECVPPKIRLRFGGDKASCIIMPDIYDK